MRVEKRWIVVVRTPSFCLALSTSCCFSWMRSDRGAERPGIGSTR